MGYTHEIECRGLPNKDFASVEFSQSASSSSNLEVDASPIQRQAFRFVHAWRWVSAEQLLSIMHTHIQALERQKEFSRTVGNQQKIGLQQTIESLERMIS